jgi:hypothetical protein
MSLSQYEKGIETWHICSEVRKFRNVNCVAGLVLPDVLKERFTFICNGKGIVFIFGIPDLRNEGVTFFRKVGSHWPRDTTTYPRRHQLWKPQNSQVNRKRRVLSNSNPALYSGGPVFKSSRDRLSSYDFRLFYLMRLRKWQENRIKK